MGNRIMDKEDIISIMIVGAIIFACFKGCGVF